MNPAGGQVAYEAYAAQAEADYAATATDPRVACYMQMRAWASLPPNLQAAWENAARSIREAAPRKEASMHAESTLPGIGPAVMCEASKAHSPVPLRFVWHHIQPHEAGGLTVPANLVQLCDSCHYSVHRLLWHIAKGLPVGPVPRLSQLALARLGFAACQVAGTVDKIPNEGLSPWAALSCPLRDFHPSRHGWIPIVASGR